jgi:hypothetical protein
VGAPAKKQKEALNISDSDINPMAPSQLKKGKKNVLVLFFPAFSDLIFFQVATTSSDPKASQGSHTSPRPILHTGRSSDRFGFKALQSNGHEKVGQNVGERDAGDRRKSVRSHEHDSSREKVRSGVGERDVGDNRESARSLHEHDIRM